jgi:phosphocarrier protein
MMLVKTAQKFAADIMIECAGHRVNAKSMLGVLTLGAGHGTKVTVTAHGDDAAGVISSIQELFACDFYQASPLTVMASAETANPLGE